MALPREEFSRVIMWLTGHSFLRLQNFRSDADEVVPLLLKPPREGRPHDVEVPKAQTAKGRVLWSLELDQNAP